MKLIHWKRLVPIYLTIVGLACAWGYLMDCLLPQGAEAMTYEIAGACLIAVFGPCRTSRWWLK